MLAAKIADLAKSLQQREASELVNAKNLNDLRERWLNPPEWTRERFLTLNLERASQEHKPHKVVPLRISRAEQDDELI